MRHKSRAQFLIAGVAALCLSGGVAAAADALRGHHAGRLPAEPLAGPVELLYHATGARDSIQVATVVHCTNIGTQAASVSFEFRDFDGFLGCTIDSLAVGATETRTVATQATAIFFEDATCPAPPTTEQGSVWIYVDPTQEKKIICSVQIVDLANQPPTFATTLDLFGR